MLYIRSVEVQGRRYTARYCGGFRLPRRMNQNGRLLGLPYYQQLDSVSCGFIAALTIIEDRKKIDHTEILAATRPSPERGVDPDRLLDCLRRFGVQPSTERLTMSRLREVIVAGFPVIASVRRSTGSWHWVVVGGVICDHLTVLNDWPAAAFWGTRLADFDRVRDPESIVCR